MTWKTHIIGGAQAGILASYIGSVSPVESGVIITASVLGSILPDIDNPRSKVARCDAFIGLVSHVATKFTKHRGFLHTVWGALLLAAIFYALAMFQTEKESLLSFFMAFSVFVLVHALGGPASKLAGWLAVAAYAFGPKAAAFLSENDIHIVLNGHAAFICALGIFIGCIMHIVYDSFNPSGIMWLYPLSKKTFSLMSVKTDSGAEYGFAAAQVAVLAVIIAACYHDTYVFESIKSLIDELGPAVRSVLQIRHML